jgi:hypothetical protein
MIMAWDVGDPNNLMTWSALDIGAPDEVCAMLTKSMISSTGLAVAVTDTFGNLLAATWIPGSIAGICPGWPGP